jgi:outer membrane protein assembly factor BamB
MLGIESAPAAYGNLIYIADNGGFLMCLDLNTMRPVWGRNVTDDTDATIVIDVEGSGTPFLYTACEVDIQGRGGFSYMRKINGFTGELVWEHRIPCLHDPRVNGGALATPVIGRGEIEHLVIFNIAKTNHSLAGKILAYNKADGGLVWELDLKSYCWSSPTVVYARSGKPFIIQCDSDGRVFLIDANNGVVMDSITLNGNVEGSPAIFEDMIVVGTREKKIYGIRLS